MVSNFDTMMNASKKSIKSSVLRIMVGVALVGFESCSLFNQGVSYSQDIFTNLTAPEEGGVNFTQLTKESDIVQGPAYQLTTESVQNGSEITRTEVLMWNTATFLSISPDGRNFTFLGNNNNSNNLYIRSTEGGASAVQRTFRNYVFDFAYSPDGKFLTFSDRVGVGAAENYNIYQIEVAKGNAVRQIAATDASELNPVYSNDAKTLFYSRSSGNGYSLWSIDLESGLHTVFRRF
jgi:Tol biopolymer transport system component